MENVSLKWQSIYQAFLAEIFIRECEKWGFRVYGFQSFVWSMPPDAASWIAKYLYPSYSKILSWQDLLVGQSRQLLHQNTHR